MTADELIAEITMCFENEPFPGDLNIVTNNTPGYDLEALQIREAFKVHTWQTLPDELMQYENTAYCSLSAKGLKYYLPAYLQFAVRAYAEADIIPDGLISLLTLPAEVDVVRSAFDIKRYQIDEKLPEIDWGSFYQNRLRELNESVRWSIDRYSQFNPAQGRAIYHFLCFMRDEHGADYWNDELQLAIDRYWFQFA
ncbi:hypothetical protein IC235_08130 [Hymenobacter sp. BT664]|uniref:Uncharacterized protein n=1 Tax=Hymenobacter montanus TaxID=2771359 RepID=A0A927GJ72_9BACT|nr:DUF6714 family protein [Hymenobacter montanus]MBD2767859.1 hypothetical protein [Hymenobacter montanus]